MLAVTPRDSRRARTRPLRSPRIRVTPALSTATSAPVPMAIPMSARASAGASLTPSPAMATIRPSDFNRVIALSLSSGKTSATTSSIPSRRATASAVRRLSPVSMMIRRPSR